MVKSACGIEAVYMCFNGTGIWGGETLYELYDGRWLTLNIELFERHLVNQYSLVTSPGGAE